MPVINIIIGNGLQMSHWVEADTELILDAYGTLERAEIYFDNRLRNQPWKKSTIAEKKAAMFEATELIDRLNFSGTKANTNQSRQFPRNNQTEVPEEIEKACYEVAFKLLDGYDPDFEIDNLSSVGQGYSSVRSTYNRSFVMEHLSAGIPSAKAWAYLKPFLGDFKVLKLRRAD